MGALRESESPSLLLTDVVLTTIKPIETLPHPKTVELTFQDDLVKDIFIPTFATCRLANKSAEEYLRLSNRIRLGLQKVLVPFYEFAGKWIPTNRGGGRQLVCDDEGVPFVEAYVDKDMDSVVRPWNEYQPIPELHGYDAVLGKDQWQARIRMPGPGGLPSLFVQMTRFKCGGVGLGVTFNHMICDGPGFYDFMTAWSDFSLSNETAIKPNHDRHLVKTFDGLFPSAAESDLIDLDVPPKPQPCVYENFQVSESNAKSLKRKVQENSNGEEYISLSNRLHQFKYMEKPGEIAFIDHWRKTG